MSDILLDFTKSFINGRVSAFVFSSAYIELWKIVRDKKLVRKDEARLSECLSSIFCAADMYCADDNLREAYEFNDEQLNDEVSSIINRYFPDDGHMHGG